MENSSGDQDRIVARFLGLVAVDGASGHESDVAAAVLRQLEEVGVTAWTDGAAATYGGDSGNVLARIPGTVPAPALLLCAHLDTVLPTRGVRPLVQPDGLITSDGTTILGADDRAGVAVLLEVLHRLRRDGFPHGPLEVAFTVSEEAGMHGSKALDTSLLEARQGLVLDSSAPCGSFVIEAPGAAAFTAVVTGRSAHAALAPEKGIHAIRIAAEAVSRLKLGRWDTTGMLNVGTIQGGTSINTVPDRVEVKGETRSPSRDGLAAQMAHVEEAFRGAAAGAGGSVDLEWTPKYAGFSLGPDEPIVRTVTRGLEEAGLEPRPLRYAAGSDANVLNGRGIACVNLGLGYRDPHSTKESIPVSSLVTSVALGLAIVRAHAATASAGREARA